MMIFAIQYLWGEVEFDVSFIVDTSEESLWLNSLKFGGFESKVYYWISIVKLREIWYENISYS